METKDPAPPAQPVAPPTPGVIGPRTPDDVERLAMARLRGFAPTQPDRALAIAEKLRRDFPNSAFAEEREALVIDALVAKGEIGQARTNAEAFLERHATGPQAERIERLTGVHPHQP